MVDRPNFLPRTVGMYRIEQELGSGSIGTVYRAIHTGLEREIALKVLHPAMLTDPGSVRRFLREAHSIACLNHPHIVSVYDAGEIDGIFFIAMELRTGKNLRSVLDEKGALPLSRVLAIAGQLVEALDHAHTRGVVHLDVKPANVLIAEDDWVTLTDFGMAQRLNSSAARSATIAGTPLYMAPERIQGKDVDGRADIYSLGLLMYEMCAGRPPFQGEIVSVLHDQLHTPLPDIRETVPNIPDEVVAVLHRATAKNRSERYRTDGELHQALESVRGSLHETGISNRSLLPLPDRAVRIDGLVNGEPMRRPDMESVSRTVSTRIRQILMPSTTTMLIVAVAGVLLLPGSGAEHARATGVPAIELQMTNTQRHTAFVSGDQVTFRWSRVPQAEVYRLQVSTVPTPHSTSYAFTRHVSSELIDGTSKTIRVVGYQVYFWRVQAKVHGKWQRYTHPKHFVVTRPSVGRPIPLTPKSGSIHTGMRIQLCWSKVQHAAAYEVHITSTKVILVGQQCIWHTFKPKAYAWTVSALVRGVRLYAGPRSTQEHFTIQAPPTPTPTPSPTRTPRPLPTMTVRPTETLLPILIPMPVSTSPPTPTPGHRRYARSKRLVMRPAPVVRPTVPRPTPMPRSTVPQPIPMPTRSTHHTGVSGVGPQPHCDPEVNAC